MNYYLDTEFLEGPQKDYVKISLINCLSVLSATLCVIMYLSDSRYNVLTSAIWGIFTLLFLIIPRNKIKTKNTIDLISIGIVCEDGREYYAISKDFNLKEAWNRYDLVINKQFPLGPEYKKVYWIRENVLKHIWEDLRKNQNISDRDLKFTYKSLKELIKKYGKSNKQIAEEIKSYTNGYSDTFQKLAKNDKNIKFHAYYADYDWVVFCWLFGSMIDLPKGFPMYCVDIKQIMDDKVLNMGYMHPDGKVREMSLYRHTSFEANLKRLKKMRRFPVNKNPHHALSDAKFDRDLHNLLNTI